MPKGLKNKKRPQNHQALYSRELDFFKHIHQVSSMRFFNFILAIAFLTGLHQLSKAQISITPNTVVIEEVDIEEFDVVAHSIFKNESNRPGTFVWERTIMEISEEWTTAVCDVNTCYNPVVSTAEFDLEAESEGILDVHVYPGGVEGGAIIKLLVYDITSEENEAIAYYYFNRQSTSTVERINNKIKTYPNPVSDQVFIEAESNLVDYVEICNIQGQVVHAQKMFSENSIFIPHIPGGNYILRMFDKDKNPLSVNLLVKQ